MFIYRELVEKIPNLLISSVCCVLWWIKVNLSLDSSQNTYQTSSYSSRENIISSSLSVDDKQKEETYIERNKQNDENLDKQMTDGNEITIHQKDGVNHQNEPVIVTINSNIAATTNSIDNSIVEQNESAQNPSEPATKVINDAISENSKENLIVDTDETIQRQKIDSDVVICNNVTTTENSIDNSIISEEDPLSNVDIDFQIGDIIEMQTDDADWENVEVVSLSPLTIHSKVHKKDMVASESIKMRKKLVLPWNESYEDHYEQNQLRKVYLPYVKGSDLLRIMWWDTEKQVPIAYKLFPQNKIFPQICEELLTLAKYNLQLYKEESSSTIPAGFDKFIEQELFNQMKFFFPAKAISGRGGNVNTKRTKTINHYAKYGEDAYFTNEDIRTNYEPIVMS